MSFLKRILVILGLAASATSQSADRSVVKDVLSAAEWISQALSSSGYKADFSVESLREVDRFFEEQAPGGKPVPGGLLSESLGSRLFAIGSYVGETIRRHSGGSWQGNDSDPQAEINVAVELKSGATFWPVQRIMKRFNNGSEDGIYVYAIALTKP